MTELARLAAQPCTDHEALCTLLARELGGPGDERAWSGTPHLVPIPMWTGAVSVAVSPSPARSRTMPSSARRTTAV